MFDISFIFCNSIAARLQKPTKLRRENASLKDVNSYIFCYHVSIACNEKKKFSFVHVCSFVIAKNIYYNRPPGPISTNISLVSTFNRMKTSFIILMYRVCQFLLPDPRIQCSMCFSSSIPISTPIPFLLCSRK